MRPLFGCKLKVAIFWILLANLVTADQRSEELCIEFSTEAAKKCTAESNLQPEHEIGYQPGMDSSRIALEMKLYLLCYYKAVGQIGNEGTLEESAPCEIEGQYQRIRAKCGNKVKKAPVIEKGVVLKQCIHDEYVAIEERNYQNGYSY